mgnify:CR=1 FL=1
MARSIEQERAQLEADEQRLNERRKQLADRERSELLKEVERSGLMKADPAQFSAIIGAIKKLGIAETVKRLEANGIKMDRQPGLGEPSDPAIPDGQGSPLRPI